MFSRLLAAVLAAIAIAGGPTPSTGPTWRIGAAPVPAGSVVSSLSSVSCPTAHTCVAVGDSRTTMTLPCTCMGFSEVLHDGRWSLRPFATDDPMIASGVSCTSTTFCVAVGATPMSAPKIHAVAQVWNGHSWKAMPSPAGYLLTSVTCLSRDWCMAVGAVKPPSSYSAKCCTLVAHWNGRSWSSVALQTPTKALALDAYLLSVSCASVSFCAAGGRDMNGGLLWFFDGHRWTLRYGGDALGHLGGYVSSVSCPSTAGCRVVGGDGISGISFVTPRLWTTHELPQGYGHGLPDVVTCTTASRCTAVGGAGFDPVRGYVMSSRGTTWTRERFPAASTTAALDVRLSAVACPTTSRCVAVGALTNNKRPSSRLLIATRG